MQERHNLLFLRKTERHNSSALVCLIISTGLFFFVLYQTISTGVMFIFQWPIGTRYCQHWICQHCSYVCLHYPISMAECKTAVTPVHEQWSFCSSETSHWEVSFFTAPLAPKYACLFSTSPRPLWFCFWSISPPRLHSHSVSLTLHCTQKLFLLHNLIIETISLEGTFCDTVHVLSSAGDMEPF